MNPVIAMLIGVVVMMVLVICTRMHAFPSLIISAILIAVLSGNYLLVGTGNEGGNLLSVAISTVTGGFGGTMTSIGIVIGFGCSVPAIMATRTLSSERDRKMTMLLIPFKIGRASCRERV